MDYQIIQLKIEAKQIENWFKETDYFANKVVRGEWGQNEPKWVAYKQEAKVKSQRLEELRKLIEEAKK